MADTLWMAPQIRLDGDFLSQRGLGVKTRILGAIVNIQINIKLN